MHFYFDLFSFAIERIRITPFASVRAEALIVVACPIIAFPSAPQKAIKEPRNSSLPGTSIATEIEGQVPPLIPAGGMSGNCR